MAAISDLVRPGDVISSDLLNRMIALLNEHDAKLASGGSTGDPGLITGFDPPAAQHVDQQMTVFGKFDFPLGTNVLTVDGIPISPSAFLPGSNDLKLIFKVPIAISVPNGMTKQVAVRVSNSLGTSQLAYTLLPLVVSAIPDPTISTAVDFTTGAAALHSGSKAQITGSNFATPAANNAVVLRLQVGGVTRQFPANGSLAVDAASSNILPAPQVATLVVTMPTFVDTDGIAVGDTAPGTLQVTVPGANNPATIGVSIQRMT